MKKDHRTRVQMAKWVAIPALCVSLLHSSVWAAGTGEASAGSTVVPEGERIAAARVQVDPEKAKITQEQAVEKLQSLFPELKKAEVDRAELEASDFDPNHYYWNIHWRYEDGNGSYGFSSRVDAMTGDLITGGIHRPLAEIGEVYYPPKVSREQALDIAKKFIQRAVPSVPVDSLSEETDTVNNLYFQEQPLFGPVTYSFYLIPTYNGIPAPNRSIRITVDGNGKVLNLYHSAGPTEYPDLEPTLTLEEAEQKYKEALDLSLHYIPIRRGENKVDWVLGWRPDQSLSFRWIDAVSGKFLTYSGDPVEGEQPQYEEIPASEERFAALEPKGDDGYISAEQAVAVVKEVAEIPEGRELASQTLGNAPWRGDDYGKLWRLTWRDPDQPGPFAESYAVVDAITGQLLEYEYNRFYRAKPDDEAQDADKISREQADKLAIQLVNRLYPDAMNELKWMKQDATVPVEPSSNSFRYRFQRFYEDIPVMNDWVNMTLDASGKLLYYRVERTPDLKEKVKDLNVQVTEEEAKAKYLENTHLRLQYQTFRGIRTTEGYQEPVIKLVYHQVFENGLNAGYAIDAGSGEWVSSWYGAPEMDKEMVKPKDIEGHWAQNELETLVQYRIIEPDEQAKIYPDQAITRGEWLEMMVRAVRPNYDRYIRDRGTPFEDVTPESPYYNAINAALEYYWIDEDQKRFEPEKQITREELAVSLTHMLGYDKLAGYLDARGDLLTFEDADQIEAKGAVLIAQELGLLNGSGGLFRPDGHVTRAQAAVVMMRLVQLQGKTDKKIDMRY
ncbi:MAG: S-layer homology domain-containing protein [Bacillaceae bacterium]|nr:S-layer homology domain-containing protein [Bacillaceae bacterium]